MHTHKPPAHWYQLKNDHGTESIVLIGNYTLMALEHVMGALTNELAKQAAKPRNIDWLTERDLPPADQLQSNPVLVLRSNP